MHILVVEDEQRLAFLLRRVLLEERHTVDLAHDVPEQGTTVSLSLPWAQRTQLGRQLT